MQSVEIVFPLPLNRSFTYLLPPDVTYGSHLLGARVIAPFGPRTLSGFISGSGKPQKAEEAQQALSKSKKQDRKRITLKEIKQLVDQPTLFPPKLYKTLCWAAEYYCEPLGQVLDTAIPSALRSGKDAEPLFITKWHLTDKGKNIDIESITGSNQRKVLQLLGVGQKLEQNQEHGESPASTKKQEQESNTEISSSALNAMRISASVLQALKKKDLIAGRKVLKLPPRKFTGIPYVHPQLTDEQQQAVDKVTASFSKYNCFLLEGVTNSGKTEVYIEIIRRALARGEQALYLVPEIGLSPQTLQRLEKSLAIPLGVIHSSLSPGARMQNYLLVARHQISVLIGTRSAAFAPLAKPGCIIVDEEHDSSYKQHSGFRYNGKHFLIKLASEYNIPIVLGSATPALESFYNARQGKYQHLRLKQKFASAGKISAQLIEMKGRYQPNNLPHEALTAIKQTLADNSQVLVFINRRGFAPQLQCSACNWMQVCSSCDRPMTLHKYPPLLACHLCETQKPIPHKCPNCDSLQITPIGLGTQSIESILAKEFPKAQILRIDRDSMSKKESFQDFYRKVQSDEPAILVGTQMLAKGHDFANVALAIIVNCDSGLLSNDFHNVEQVAQLITQVIGRVGRRKSGRIIIPTYYPEHPVLQTLIRRSYADFAKLELDNRNKFALPPYHFLAYLRAEALKPEDAQEFLNKLKDSALDQARQNKAQLLGPIESSIAKRLNFYRFVVLIKSESRQALHKVVHLMSEQAQQHNKSNIAWHLDIDPIDPP